MHVLSIINIKGGVGKTATTVNMAYDLAAYHKKRVLVIDLDGQGHSSMFFGARNTERDSVAEVLMIPHYPIRSAIISRDIGGVTIDILPADMRLVRANRELLVTIGSSPKRLATALRDVADDYDFVLIDHAPHVDMATINGLVASDEVLVPVTLDEFAADGLSILTERVEELQEEYNPRLHIIGCFAAQYSKSKAAVNALRSVIMSGMPMWKTVVRRTCRVPESEEKHLPLSVFAPTSTAAQDYEQLCVEYLEKVSELDTFGGN